MSRVSRLGVVYLSVVIFLYYLASRIAKLPTLDYEIHCFDKSLDYRIASRGEFWVLYNYVPATRTFACHESVTYTTHTDFRYLDNLQPVIERWRAPVSIALYVPGTDFATTLACIQYLRKCGSPLIAEYVSFHLYFDHDHLPKTIPRPEHTLNFTINCTTPPPWHDVDVNTTYRSRNNLHYPINVGRNVARDGAQTHFILACDIELYPSPGLASDFLSMVRTQKHEGLIVFPLCPFEIESYALIPSTKAELVSMLNNGTAIQFDKKLCFDCHHVPKMEEWMRAPLRSGVNVFHVTRWKTKWEPFYIGTNADPYFDEFLSWEGLRDKMTQCYALCVKGYEFHILDGAFLVHRPGIKQKKERNLAENLSVSETNSIIENYILPTVKLLYGTREECNFNASSGSDAGVGLRDTTNEQ